MSGGRSGGLAESDGRKPAHSEGVSLSKPADRSLSVAGQLLLPRPTGCNVPVSPPGERCSVLILMQRKLEPGSFPSDEM